MKFRKLVLRKSRKRPRVWSAFFSQPSRSILSPAKSCSNSSAWPDWLGKVATRKILSGCQYSWMSRSRGAGSASAALLNSAQSVRGKIEPDVGSASIAAANVSRSDLSRQANSAPGNSANVSFPLAESMGVGYLPIVMKKIGSALLWLLLLMPWLSFAQIDPIKRDLVQVGYNGAFEGHQPFAGYAFYYHNQPDFLRETNLTLRAALSPTYVDSELGIGNALGANTDLGIGAAGGAFADSYNEIRGGTFYPDESFDGYGGEGSLSLYHLFDPGRLIPLSLVLRGTAHYSAYARNSDTGPTFDVPNNYLDGSVRAGLRFGGVEPTLFPALAMELSVWYEGHVRSNPSAYGYDDDRRVNPE